MLVEANTGGLAQVEKYYQDYGGRARELRGQGGRIIGYLCAFVPLEVLTAAGFIPFRIKGSINEPITRADTQMETIVCPLVRSCYDLTLKGNYEFLEGFVFPHACDSICKTYDLWRYTLGLPYSHKINMPHGIDDSSLKFFASILGVFRKTLGKFAGKDITDDRLLEAVKTYNMYRSAVRGLFELRKLDLPLISGTEVTKILIAGMSIPVEEATHLVASVTDEVRQRPVVATRKPRIMIVGAQVDDASFIELVEDSGAHVVADDLCPGAREYSSDVEITDDLIGAIAERYLRKIRCSRTFREQKGTYPEYLDDRFGHIVRAIKDYSVDGVILYIYKYCDPFGFEVPTVRSYIESCGIPVLYLEDDYTMSNFVSMKTRVQAFLEMIGLL